MKIIACGAGGNKAAQALVYHHVLPNLDNILMMNSTERDFPKEAAKNCVLIQNIGGCGKEREIGKEIMVSYLDDPVARNKLDEFLGEDTHLVLIGSMGGGTGSGGLNVLAKYAKDLLEMDVTLIAFKGFLEDTREMKNTIDFLKEVPDNIAIQIIDNASFLNDCGGNKVRAEFVELVKHKPSELSEEDFNALTEAEQKQYQQERKEYRLYRFLRCYPDGYVFLSGGKEYYLQERTVRQLSQHRDAWIRNLFRSLQNPYLFYERKAVNLI